MHTRLHERAFPEDDDLMLLIYWSIGDVGRLLRIQLLDLRSS